MRYLDYFPRFPKSKPRAAKGGIKAESSGTVQMPIGETFWSARFGMLTDRFGVPWMINCAKATGV